jgi:hypothetical protein
MIFRHKKKATTVAALHHRTATAIPCRITVSTTVPLPYTPSVPGIIVLLGSGTVTKSDEKLPKCPCRYRACCSAGLMAVVTGEAEGGVRQPFIYYFITTRMESGQLLDGLREPTTPCVAVGCHLRIDDCLHAGTSLPLLHLSGSSQRDRLIWEKF